MTSIHPPAFLRELEAEFDRECPRVTDAEHDRRIMSAAPCDVALARFYTSKDDYESSGYEWAQRNTGDAWDAIRATVALELQLGRRAVVTTRRGKTEMDLRGSRSERAAATRCIESGRR